MVSFANDHSRPQSPSFPGHVVGYKLSRVSLGDENVHEQNIICRQTQLDEIGHEKTIK